MTRKRGLLNDSASSCILRSPCRDVVVGYSVSRPYLRGASAPPDHRDGPRVCLRGTRSLKTEQDEEADQSAPFRRHGDRWTPVRLAYPSGCARFNEYPVAWSFIAETRLAFGPAATDHKTDRSDGSLRYLSFRALLSLLVSRLRALAPSFHGEFDPGSGRTLAACLTHASRARKHLRV